MKYIFVSFLFLLLVHSANSQDSLSLSDALTIGLQNSYQLKIAQKNIEIAENNNNYGQAGRYPTISFNVNSRNAYTNNDNPAAFINIPYLADGITGNIDVAWTIFDGHRVALTKRQLEQLVKQNQGNAAVAIENTIQSILQSYYNALIQKERLNTLKTVLDLSKDRIRYEEIRNEFGSGGKFDLLQAKDALLNDSTNYLIQLNSYENAIRNLNLTMREKDLSKTYELTESLDATPSVYLLADLKEKMNADNKSLQNQRVALELARVSSDLQRASLKPRIGLNTGVNQSGNYTQLYGDNPQTGEPYGGVFGSGFDAYLNFSLSYTIYNGGKLKRAVENAKIQERIAKINISDVKHQLDAQLVNTLASYNNQVNLLNLTQNSLQNAEENLAISEERFKGGLINSFDYRTVQLLYVNAALSRQNAFFNLKNTETELIRLIGGLVKE